MATLDFFYQILCQCSYRGERGSGRWGWWRWWRWWWWWWWQWWGWCGGWLSEAHALINRLIDFDFFGNCNCATLHLLARAHSLFQSLLNAPNYLELRINALHKVYRPYCGFSNGSYDLSVHVILVRCVPRWKLSVSIQIKIMERGQISTKWKRRW